MTKLFLPILLVVVLFSACGKEGPASTPCDTITTKAPDAEVGTLKAWIESQNITATADDRGFYYVIKTPGTGGKINPCSSIKVNYRGRLTTGQEFDANNGITFNLANLITGWREGIPLIEKGGNIMLYLPPSLAYGTQAQSGIPANSILIFTIDVVEVY